METFYVTVLPRTPRVDIDRLDLVFAQPLLDFSGDKLRAIVTANITRYPLSGHRLFQHGSDLSRRELAFDLDGQRLPGILIQQRHHFQRAPLVSPIEDEIPTPHMVAMCRLGGQPGR